MYYEDGEFMYFMIFLEADPNPGSNTYAVLLEDGANDGDYDFVISSYGSTNARVYSWHAGLSEWSQVDTYGSGYYRYETTNNQEHVALAVKFSDTFTPSAGDDYAKAVTSDANFRAFNVGWAFTRNPTPGASAGDYTTATAIPEFSSILMPIASVALIVGNRIRNKKITQQ